MRLILLAAEIKLKEVNLINVSGIRELIMSDDQKHKELGEIFSEYIQKKQELIQGLYIEIK
jgi:hypothetical protein